MWLVENGVDMFVEVGVGKVLIGMVKCIVKEVKGFVVNMFDDIDGLIDVLFN